MFRSLSATGPRTVMSKAACCRVKHSRKGGALASIGRSLLYQRMLRIEPVLLPVAAGAEPFGLVPGPRPPRPRRRREVLRWAIIISVQLHLILLAIFLLIPPRRQAEAPPPDEVQMVFAPGSSAPVQMPGSEPKPEAPKAAPAPRTQPEPTPPVPPQPLPTPPLPAAPPSPASAPPPPAPEAPAEESATSVPPPSPTRARQPQPQSHPARPPTAFPRPQFSSLGNVFGGVVEGNPQARRSGGSRLQAFRQVSGTPLGDDWWERFRTWVENHKYYPQQAAEQGQEGVVVVEVQIAADGRVTIVDLRHRSGSQWLDMGLMGMFRGATVPPISSYVPDKTVTVQVQMTYMLIR